MICGVATDNGIPGIWGEVGVASNKQSVLAMLVQYLMGDLTDYRRTYLGHSDLLHFSIPLYNFVTGDRFVNPKKPCMPYRWYVHVDYATESGGYRQQDGINGC